MTERKFYAQYEEQSHGECSHGKPHAATCLERQAAV